MNNIEKSCCFTGHRKIAKDIQPDLEITVYNTVVGLAEQGFTSFYCGGALGFDTIAARAVLKAKEKYNVKLILLLPFSKQTNGWSADNVAEYERIKRLADSYVYTSEGVFGSNAYFIRDRALVDASSICVCYCNKKGGGTAYTVGYAKKQGKKVINLCEDNGSDLPQIKINF